MFRVDQDTIIDATKCGNLARFINHSCNVSMSCWSCGWRLKWNKITKCVVFCLAAELLRKDHHRGVSEEDSDILPAADRHQRRDHIRLQVSHRGNKDSLFVRSRWLPRLLELISNEVSGAKSRLRYWYDTKTQTTLKKSKSFNAIQNCTIKICKDRRRSVNHDLIQSTKHLKLLSTEVWNDVQALVKTL